MAHTDDDKKGVDDQVSDDVVVEDEAEESNPRATIKRLREELRVCSTERQEYLEGWQRSKADFVNARKENEKERAELRTYAAMNVIAEIIPIADNFERAIANKEAWGKVEKNWRVGVEYIYTQLQTVLHNHGVEEVGRVGEKFDAWRHQSMEAIPVTDPAEDDTVLELIEKGYMLHDRILRPAKVKIGHLSETQK